MPARAKFRRTMTDGTGTLARALLNGDRRALARAITLVESGREDHRVRAEELLDAVAGVRQAVIAHRAFRYARGRQVKVHRGFRLHAD